MPEPPFRIHGIDHVVLRVADLSLSLDFYCDLLGCVLERQIADIGLYQLRAGDHLIDLVPVGSRLGGSEPVEQRHRNQDHFCLTVDGFDPVKLDTYFTAQGVTISPIEQRYGAGGMGRSLYISDPDGNQIEIKERSR